MDPCFQPQNTSPYPNLHPQNPAYQGPGTQSGPNKYPNLPPINNPQPYPQYPNNNAGYAPPGQYGHVQVRVNEEEDREKLRLNEELAKLDKDFNSCSIKCYKFWSYATFLWAALATTPFVMELISRGDNIPPSQLIPYIIYGFWLISQSIVAIRSISKKSVSLATLGCWMVTISLIVGLAIEAWIIHFLVTYPEPYRRRSWPYFFAQVYLVVNSVYLVLHIVINMVGAFKLRKILIERAKVQVQLINNSSFA